jgi:hypothetical protein
MKDRNSHLGKSEVEVRSVGFPGGLNPGEHLL